jgi:hypothetical protein
MNMRKAARTAFAVPLMIGGGALVLAFGTGNVLAAPASHPQSSSRPHPHENVVCSPATISAGSSCTVTFTDIKTGDEPHPAGKTVCFSVSPTTAGTFAPTCSTLALFVGKQYTASSTFTANSNFCPTPPSAMAIIYATEPNEHNQRHHTTETITCGGTATNTSFTVPAGGPSPPAGGWLVGAMGAGVALATSYALRRRFAPRRLAADQSA